MQTLYCLCHLRLGTSITTCSYMHLIGSCITCNLAATRWWCTFELAAPFQADGVACSLVPRCMRLLASCGRCILRRCNLLVLAKQDQEQFVLQLVNTACHNFHISCCNKSDSSGMKCASCNMLSCHQLFGGAPRCNCNWNVTAHGMPSASGNAMQIRRN